MKKLNIKILIAVFVGLVTLFVVSRLFRSPGLESNLKKTLVDVDTAAVTEVRIQPAKDRANEIRLVKEGKNWQVATTRQKALSDRGAVNSMLGVVRGMKIQRMAARKKEKWESFQVADNSTHVTLLADGKAVADFHVGKTGTAQGAGYGSVYTYVRVSDEREVYAVEGFIESHFNRVFNDWRNKAFLRLKGEDLTKITFVYPSDSGFVVMKKDSLWQVGNEKADVGKVSLFTSALGYKNLTDFDDAFVAPGAAPVVVRFEGKNGVLASVEAWKSGDHWTLKSTEQNSVYFTAQPTALKDFLVGRRYFLPVVK